MTANDQYVWRVVSYENLPELIPGDILVWTDSYWFPHMIDELSFLAAVERQENESLSEACKGIEGMFNEPTGKQQCHWCIYIGDDKIVQMGGEVCISPNPIQTVYPPSGWTGPVIFKVYRFHDKGMDADDGVGFDTPDGTDSSYWE